jgi:5-methylcytosine-specific restriction endonuclease McrA
MTIEDKMAWSSDLQWLNNEQKKRTTGDQDAVAEYLRSLPIARIIRMSRKRPAVGGSRAKRFTNDLTLTNEQWEYVLSLYDHKCLCCGTKYNITVDHIVPLSEGGSHSMSNVQPLCDSCNSRKGTKSTDYRAGKAA